MTVRGKVRAGNTVLRALLAATVLAGGMIPATVVHAQEAATASTRDFDIPEQNLDDALLVFARQSGWQVSSDSGLTASRRSALVRGAFSPAQALSQLLAGTGLTFRFVSANAVRIEPAPQSTDGAVQLGPVRVEGALGAGSGWSRDPGASEGTGSYTTRVATIGKTATSLRETPHSVSVITRQRLDDQNTTSLTDATKYTTGVVVQRFDVTDLTPSYSSRGYTNDSIQIDGLNFTNGSLQGNYDLAIYDRVEVQRGVAGLLKGTGVPGLTINLVRKRALASFQVNGQARIGSWENFRGEADVTGALLASGQIRGRLVAVGEDRGSYLNGVDSNQKIAYGTLEFDLTENTALSVGGNWRNLRSVYSTGLPASSTGRLFDVPRSTAIVADWTYSRTESSDGFAELEHRLDNGGRLKVSARLVDRSTFASLVRTGAAVPEVGNLSLRADTFDREESLLALDGYFDSPFRLWGQTHNFLFGADHRTFSRDTFDRRSSTIIPANMFSYDPAAIPQPAAATYGRFAEQQLETESTGLYGQLRIKPISPLTLIAGARLSWFKSDTLNQLTNNLASEKASGEFTPYGAVVVDLGRTLSLYGSYAEIFEPQTQTTVASDTLPPRVGSQVETGIKGEFFDKRLNAHIAVFRINDQNRALADPDNAGFSIPAGKVRSEGFEAEISGEVASGFNITAGYAYTTTKYIRGTAAQTGQTFDTFTPKHNFNIWAYYKFPERFLPGLELGGGLRAASKTYARVGNVLIQGDSYAIASLAVGYRVSEHLKVMLNVENVFDRYYYEKVQAANSQNYYGQPRSFMLTLRGTW